MITGKRVRLRPMDIEDTDLVVRWRNDPSIRSWLFTDKPVTPVGHHEWLKQTIEAGNREEFVIIEVATGHAVGTIGLSEIDRGNRHAEYGILIGESAARGRGLAAEASHLILVYAFQVLQLNRIYLQLFPDNRPAIHLYERLGFKHEGILRQHVRKEGRFRDILVMGMVREDNHDPIL